MSRLEDVFGGVAVSTRQTVELYTATGGETFVQAEQSFVTAVLVINGEIQNPGVNEQYTIDGRKFTLKTPLVQGDKVQKILNTAWSPKEIEGQYTQIVQFRSTGGETSYTPSFSFSSVLMFFNDRPFVPGVDYNVQNGKIVYTSSLPADKQAYIIFNGGKGDLAFYKKLDEANADKAELLQRILNVYPVNHPVSSQAAMLALDAKPGDNATRSDQQRVYYLAANPASNLDNWKPFIEIDNSVITVNGRVGDVVVAEAGANNDITSLSALSGPLRLGGDAVNAYDAVTLKQLQAAGGGTGANMTGVMNNFLGAVDWFNGSRAKLPSGYVPADGQLLNRADYPDIWAAINSGIFVSVTDANWLNASGTSYVNRGKYSTGDGSTTFRMPDLNGIQSGSLDGLFLSAAAKAVSAANIPARDVGVVFDQNAPNIKGSLAVAFSGSVSIFDSGTGAFVLSGTPIGQSANFPSITTPANRTVYGNTDFSARNYNGTYNDNSNWLIPRSVGGIWIIRVNGKFSASGTSFDVIKADASLPSNGTQVLGGDVRSLYQVNGADYLVSKLKAKAIIGGAKQTVLEQVDSSGSSAVTTTWNLPATSGDLFGTGDLANTPWTNLTLQAGWVTGTNQRAVYRKVLGLVFIDLHIMNGAYSDNTVIAGLPGGFTPPSTLHYVPFAVAASNQIPPRIVILTTGEIRCLNVGGNSDMHLTVCYSVQ